MNVPSIPDVPGAPQEASFREAVRDGWGVLRRRWPLSLVVFIVVLATGVGLLATRKPFYQTSAMLILPWDYGSSGSGGIMEDPLVELMRAGIPNGFQTHLQMLQRPSLIQQAERAAGLVPGSGANLPTVTVDAQRENNAIQINVTGSSPQLVASVANNMVDIHMGELAQSMAAGLSDSLRFAQDETQKAFRNLKAADRQLSLFRRQHRVVGPSAEQQAQAGELAASASRVSEIDSNINVTKAQRANVQSRLNQEPVELLQQSTRENPRRVKLENKLDDLSFQRMDLLREFRPTSRQVRDVNQEIARTQRLIDATPAEIKVPSHVPNPNRASLQSKLDELDATLQGLGQNRSAALGQFSAQRAVVSDLGPLEIQLDRLTHDQEAAQQAYTSLQNRLQDLEVRSRALGRLSRSTISVIRAEVPTRPNSPLKPKHLTVIALMALVLATGMAYLLEYRDDRLASPESADRLLRLPILGHVPLVPGGEPLITAVPDDSPLVETYRALRAKIGFASMDAPLRTMIVTSAHHGEGRSTVALNLAIAMAMAGRSVVLVDADLRHSSLHRLLGLPAGPGLTDVLMGHTAAEEVLAATAVSGLRVLTSGIVLANPADLLSRAPMATLVDELCTVADVVVIDTPPCLPVTDAQLLATQVHGVLLVADVGEAKKSELKHAVHVLDDAYARLVGVIFNKCRQPMAPRLSAPINGSTPVAGALARPRLPAASKRSAEVSEPSPPLSSGHLLTYMALVLFSLVLWFRPYELIPALASVKYLALACAVLTLVLFVPSQLALEGKLTARIREVNLVLLLCLTALLSMPLAVDRGQAWETFNTVFIKAILIFIVMVNVVRTERRLMGLLLIALGSGVMLSVGVLNDYWHGRFTVAGYRETGFLRSMFDDPNDLAVHLLTMMAIAFGLLLGTRSRAGKAAYAGCTLLMTAAVALTYSRGGFLGLVAVALAAAWKLRRQSPLAVGAMALLILIAFVMVSPQGYVQRIESIFDPSLDPNGSASARRDLLMRSFTVALANPAFGVGMGDFSIVGLWDHETHNAYTQVATEMGIPALCLYTGFILTAFRRLQHIQREISPVGNAGRLHYLAFGLQISLVGYMVSSFFVSVAYYWYIYYLVAYAVCLHRISSTLPGEMSGRTVHKAALLSRSRTRNRWARTAGARAA